MKINLGDFNYTIMHEVISGALYEMLSFSDNTYLCLNIGEVLNVNEMVDFKFIQYESVFHKKILKNH